MHGTYYQMRSTIEQSFVAMRRANKAITGDDLHVRLTLAQLVGAAHGKTALEDEHWQHALQLAESAKLSMSDK